ncbi:heme biosynthesis HemY N-terminal domain-containing protein [Aliiroseovarius subalbicans]|uniref:heme biosynthesis protein HemY n=1 Tax=Aliiroseovarius subalbicans TaxID=2925840 RepID=UPI001F574E67|nr:heme biosynthesis HemY N-terminal domain-containing protein [Aliiroseovarius subalbicans]MCI2400009.1 heme biosynthesis protein HemY [Aliiroseovarius subalbicans]
MFWSLFKIILFVAAIALLTIGAGMLMETEGGIRIGFGGLELNMGPLQAAIAAIALIIAVWLLIVIIGLVVAFVRFLNGDETAISRYFDRSREKKGYEALADGMMALASGDGSTAISKATRAERYLRRPELTTLLTAQAAEMSGDKIRAQQAYKKLLRDDRTRFVGVRGIMKQKLVEGDTDTAMKLAEKAFALKPRHEDTQDVLLQLQADKGDWKGARKTLGAKLKYGALPRDVHKRRDAVLALSEAKDVLEEGSSVSAREAAIEANRLSPDLVPAAVMAARAYMDAEKPRNATRVLTKAWTAQPHPDLAAAFAAIVPDETPAARLKRFRALTKHREGDAETRMLLSELHISAEDFPAARKALGGLPDNEPTQRSLTLMAAIERGEGADDAVVRGWLARAVTASRGPQWVCENCNHIHGHWAPTCDNCQGFDTLSWKVPPEGEVSIPGGTDMLPLIVAAPTPEPEPEIIETPSDDDPHAPAADFVEEVTEEAEIIAPEVEGKH